MPDSNMSLYMAIELAAVLLLVAIFLLVHVSKLKKLIAMLEEKIKNLRVSMGLAKKDAKEAQEALTEAQKIKPKTYMDFIDEHIEDTRDHHQTHNPDRDIVLDISMDAPIERQAAALRHALLIAEKEACYAGEEGYSDWGVLQSKLQQLIQFYEQSAEPDVVDAIDDLDLSSAVDDDAHQAEIADYKKRIENLERFKKLFFDMEAKWKQAKKDSDSYHEQLVAMGSELGAGEEFEELMNKYASSYDEVGNLINNGAGDSKISVEIDARTTGSNRTIIGNQEEMLRLRNMAVDQHKVITNLKKKLLAADSAEAQKEVVAELTEQLERQERFLKEAETCTQLLEDELNRAIDENQALREAAEQGGASEDLAHLEELVSDLTKGSQEMLKAIAALEDENNALQQQIVGGLEGGQSSENVEKLQAKLVETQQELLNLQTQHIELEERYLELKMEGM